MEVTSRCWSERASYERTPKKHKYILQQESKLNKNKKENIHIKHSDGQGTISTNIQSLGWTDGHIYKSTS